MAYFASNEPNAAIPQISREALRSARRLLQHKQRIATGFFLAEGAQAVREALRSPGIVDTLIVDNPDQHRELVELAMAGDQLIEVLQGSRAELAGLSDTKTPQGIVAVCNWSDAQLQDVVNPKLVVICAQVRDPGNAGTVVRCADAFGADAVILTKGSVDITNPKTVRASVGSIFHLPVISGVTLAEAIDWAHHGDLQVVAADGSGQPVDLMAYSGQLAKPTAWLMGNEAWGFPSQDLALADQVAAVPMWGQAESLNLSTAAAVCLYASASAQRRVKP